MLANASAYSTIEQTMRSRDYVNQRRHRLMAGRFEGFRARYKGPPPTLMLKMEARMLAKTRETPPHGSTRKL